MTSDKRKFTNEKKAEIVRKHLADKVPVSDLAEQHSLQPSQIHKWIRIVLAQAEKAFDNERSGDAAVKQREQAAKDRKIEQLEAKLTVKNEVIAELMEENVKAKKSLGNSKGSLGSSRHARSGRRLHCALERACRVARPAIARLVGAGHEQVSRVEAAVWFGQRA